MGKITVKHYLNTNLKPYIINGAAYYSIYALVTANRQNTKVKSKVFNEYYSESDFAEISSGTNKEDISLLLNEAKTIEVIVSVLISKINLFDTALFSALYNYFQEIFVFDLELHYKDDEKIADLYDKDKNRLGVQIDSFFTENFSLKENNAKGMSLYTWFSPLGQQELSKFLVKNNCLYDTRDAVKILNDIVFETSFEKMNWILKGSQKSKLLLDKYNNLFEGYFPSTSFKEIGINE